MQPFRILAVDDDPVFLMLLQNVLRRIGYTDLHCVQSGDDALTLLRKDTEGFDCFLLDIDMPKMDGIELCRRVRAMPGHRQTPILMITAMDGHHFVEAAFRVGATDYVHKPIDDVEMRARLGVVRQLVDERRRGHSLTERLATNAGLPMLAVGYDDPLQLGDVGSVIEYLALENYTLTLGRMRLYGQMAIGFQVANAQKIYQSTDAVGYVDTMANVASVIGVALKTEQYIMAFAGRGEFVAVTSRRAEIDVDMLRVEIAVRLSEYRELHVGMGIELPVVRVGQPQSVGFFTRSTALGLLERARQSARQLPAGRWQNSNEYAT